MPLLPYRSFEVKQHGTRRWHVETKRAARVCAQCRFRFGDNVKSLDRPFSSRQIRSNALMRFVGSKHILAVCRLHRAKLGVGFRKDARRLIDWP